MGGYPLKLVVGLGNPGPEYARTRHNAGFWFVDELARRHGGAFRLESRFRAELARVRIADRELWLAKPQGWMNRSGAPVASLLAFYRIEPGEMLVAHDEIDLPVGVPRLKLGGGHGGQNGLRDVIGHIGADFLRLRIGVGHPGNKHLVADYVLHRAGAEEERQLLAAVAAGSDIVPLLIEQGLQKATHRLHSASADAKDH